MNPLQGPRIALRVVSFAAAFVALILASDLHATLASDPWITTQVKMLLVLSPEVDGTGIHVDTLNGRVTLFGRATTDAERTTAERIAAQVIGVQAVRNLIVVVAAPHLEEVEIADETLADSVGRALRTDPVLSAGSIRVESVVAGTVVLGGHAATLSEQRRALQLVRGLAGVHRVASVIEGPQVLSDAEISGDPLTEEAERNAARDTWLATAVKVQLMADPRIPARDVSVDAENGVVTIFGVVSDDKTKEGVARVAKAVGGVREVKNELLVRSGQRVTPTVSDAELRHQVAEALRGDPALADAHIIVDVPDGAVRLSGWVVSRDDHLRAHSLALRTADNRAVVDALQIGPPADTLPIPPAVN